MNDDRVSLFMLTQDDIKKQVAIAAAQLVKDKTTIGLGTGSTAYWLILELGKRVAAGLQIKAVPTSKKTASLAAEHGIPIVELNDVMYIDLTIDGADEIDPQLQCIKGGGGALLQEKMVAAASREFVVIVDHTKKVEHLGTFPLPLDVIPFGWKQVQQRVQDLYKVQVTLRLKDGKPFVTDHQHYILDCHFHRIEDAESLSYDLNAIPGVADCGLFVNLAASALVGFPDGQIIEMHR